MRRLALVYPTEPVYRQNRDRTFSSAQLMALAALVPPEFEIVVFEEQRGESVDFTERVDVACLSLMTSQAPRAYAIADAYRQAGTKVILGGIHPTVLPEEALAHADAVVAGEAEPVFAEVLDDVLRGRSQGVYRPAELTAPEEIPPFRHDLFARNVFDLALIKATRGCPFDCEFCSVPAVQGRRFRTRPASQIMAEIASLPNRRLFFLDDNIVGNPAFAKELFSELTPLRRPWIGQASLDTLTRDDELLHLTRASGCVALLFGVESLSADNLADVNALGKSHGHSQEALAARLDKVRRAGIMAMPYIMLGFDHDDITVFERTVRFLLMARVPICGLPILTPMPGTAFYDRMAGEGRITDRNWAAYTGELPVFEPAQMSRKDLKDGADWATVEFYRWLNILTRTPSQRANLFYYLAMNLGFFFNARKYHEGHRRFEAGRRQRLRASII